MGHDVSADVAGSIAESKVFGSSDNIRHGKYKMLIKRVFAELVETDKGKHRMAFWELTPLTSEPNPQIEGDHTDYPGNSGPLRDDGLHPNTVGSNCALKVNFDGAGARSAGSNIKAPILALFNQRDGEATEKDINQTWLDLSRQRPLRVGEVEGIDQNNQPILATKDKQANPACGMVIGLSTVSKRKKTANDKGAYVTKLVWSCVAPIGTGENAPELVAKRRAEIEAARIEDEEEEAAAVAAAPPASALVPPPVNGTSVAPPAPPTPVAPPVAKPYLAGWEPHPTAAGYFFKQGVNQCFTEAQLAAGAGASS